jgi:hypothetical protein
MGNAVRPPGGKVPTIINVRSMRASSRSRMPAFMDLLVPVVKGAFQTGRHAGE